MIPQRFHRVWVGGGMPPQFVETGQSWLDHHPDWHLTTWTEDTLPTMQNQAIFDDAHNLVESRLLGRFRSNIARLELLYLLGGVYIDCDMVARAAIPERYLQGETWFAEQEPGLVNNGIIIAPPGHDFILHLLNEIPESVRRNPGKSSVITTGPRFIQKHLDNSAPVIPTHEVYPYHWSDIAHDREIDLGDSWAHHLWAGTRQQVSVIIPWRPGCPHREAAKDYVTAYLAREFPEWQVTLVDSTSAKFSRTEAIQRGMLKSFGKIIVVHDSDMIAYGLPEAVAQVAQGASWARPHGNMHRLTPEATQSVLEGADPLSVLHDCHEKPYRSLDCAGVVVLKREVVEDVKPDARFQGWGGEDDAWATALRTLVGDPWRSSEPMVHLWHPPAERKSRAVGNDENQALLDLYHGAKGDRERMRRLVEGKPLKRVATFQHTITGRLWMAKVGTEIYDRYSRNRYLREVVGEPPKDF
jgi:hypothetical protein